MLLFFLGKSFTAEKQDSRLGNTQKKTNPRPLSLVLLVANPRPLSLVLLVANPRPLSLVLLVANPRPLSLVLPECRMVGRVARPRPMANT